MLSRRLVALRRELAAAQRDRQALARNGREALPRVEDRLWRHMLRCSLEVSQLEALLELAEHPELELCRTIGPGTAIEVVDAVSGQSTEYRLVGEEWDAGSTIVDVGTPVGQALLGRQQGSLVTIPTPDGLRRVRVVRVRGLEDSDE